MYHRLTEYRGCFIEVGQAVPDGRRWYVGRLKAIDTECIVLEVFNSDGSYYADLMLPLGTIISAYSQTCDSVRTQALVEGRRDTIAALERCFNSSPDCDGGMLPCL